LIDDIQYLHIQLAIMRHLSIKKYLL